MTAADRNHTADAHHALVEAGYEPAWATVALHAVEEVGYDVVARTPDTPTDSDTAARARALLDAATPGDWDS